MGILPLALWLLTKGVTFARRSPPAAAGTSMCLVWLYRLRAEAAGSIISARITAPASPRSNSLLNPDFARTGPYEQLELRPHSDTLYLIDASIFIFRAYHSVPISLVDRDGNPVNALHGFGRFLGDLIERVRPEHIAVAFDDTRVESFRKRLFPAYKLNREPPPEDLKRQFALCRRLCEALGVASFASNEYEADDIIGTLATRMRAAGKKVVLVTRDKDLSQLVRPGDEYWDYISDERFAYEGIAERFGVLPERMPCFLALMGDAVDNIPGVPGIGRKTASLLFRHFESLMHLYDDLDRVLKIKIRNAGFVAGQLRDYRERAFLARQLTMIACDVPLDVQLSCLARRSPDMAALNELYDAVGFGRLLRNQAERIAEAK